MAENNSAHPISQTISSIDNRLQRLIYLDGERIAYLIIFAVAIITRFWDLGARVMSHDESLHTKYSWNLYRGDGFSHTPMMHGPLLFHMVALSYLLFGDNDFSSRIYPAVLGVIIVMFPILLKKWLGQFGSLAASVFFLISPMILYYSRYIRHDIPAILAAMVMALMIWRYIEERKFKYLVIMAIAQAILFASKEVSFIYVAIFGSFLTVFWITRLIDVKWQNKTLRSVFVGSIVVGLLAGSAIMIMRYAEIRAAAMASEEEIAETMVPLDPDMEMPLAEEGEPTDLSAEMTYAVAIAGASVLVAILSVLVGQWRNLRQFPELDVAITMGSLILPMLSPFLIHFAGFDPMDATETGVARGISFTLPLFVASVVIGMAQFMQPPRNRQFPAPDLLSEEEIADLGDRYDPETQTIEVQPDPLDWITAFLSSRWLGLGGAFWLIFVFFFTTMFTNGNGLGTGIVGSLGYWLAQQEVERGGQPWYYYILIQIPMYEFMPALLTTAAGGVGLAAGLRSLIRSLWPGNGEAEAGLPSNGARFKYLDLLAPIRFPVLLFTGYWALINLIAYSIAGEKMPWLTTHLTTPMILIGAWLVGRAIERINWRDLWEKRGWLLIVLVPVMTAALLSIFGPGCTRWPRNVLCNTVVPVTYQTPVFSGKTVSDLSATGVWIAAALVLIGCLALLIYHLSGRIRLTQVLRLLGLFVVGWLSFLTARSAFLASFVNYDYANEFLVYAHSNRAVKDVLEQIEEISYTTTGDLGLRVAYDNRMSWPMSWYFRNYYNQIYFGEQPSRGLIGDAPVIVAGSANWSKVEALIGDRYYQFDYIRMVWPMQDYFGYDDPSDLISKLRDILNDPELQRGLWDIFYSRNYETYADAVMKYRDGYRPDFSLGNWPVPDRMRLYIRKDVFALVWDYGVVASEIADAIDPYAEGERVLVPDLSFGQGFLNRPHGISLGADGLIYVADSNNHQIAVFNADGAYIRSIATGALNEPWDVASAPTGSLYIADTWNHRVSAYASNGDYLLAWGYEGAGIPNDTSALWGPRAIAVDLEGDVYLSDTGNKRIMVYDPQGNYIRQIGVGGGLDGQLDEPAGLAFGPDGFLYVADTWNQRIQVFTRDGLFIRQWLVEAWYAQSNERPYLDVDAYGRVYVTDPDASRVLVFSSQGQYLYSFGDFTNIGQAGSIAVDIASGRMFVVDTANGRILRYTLPEDTIQSP
nr:TIGR03663 family protein [Anaerolineae bacterium]